MKGKLFTILVAVALLASFVALQPAFAKSAVKPPDYFPLGVGYWWTYKNVEKNMEFTLKVTGKEKIGEYDTFKVETVASNGMVMIIEYYAKVKGKVLMIRQDYPTSKMTVSYNPVREYLHNPLTLKDTWNWKGKGMMDVDINDTANVVKFENIQVPAGKFNTANVESKLIQGGAETLKSYWYAPEIGLVKSTTESGGVKNTMELIKYNLKAGKK